MKNSKDTNKKSQTRTSNNPLAQNVYEINDNKPWKKFLLTYGIAFAIGLLIVGAICLFKKIYNAADAVEVFHILTDATFVPGIIIVGFGFLVFCTNGGVFDMLSFAALSFAALFMKDITKRKYRTYYEYKEAVKDRKKPIAFLLVVGLVYIALSMLFLLLWYSNGGRSTATEAIVNII